MVFFLQPGRRREKSAPLLSCCGGLPGSFRNSLYVWEETGDWQEWVDDQSEAFTHLVDGLNSFMNRPQAPWMELYSWFLKQPEYKKRWIRCWTRLLFPIFPTFSKAAVRALYGKLENSVTTLENYSLCLCPFPSVRPVSFPKRGK